MDLKTKINKMRRIEELEDIILSLEEWKEGRIDKKIEQEFGPIQSIDNRDKLIKFIKDNIEFIKDEPIDSNKLFLTDIVKKENPKFGSNNLILAPVGSGKSTLIEEVLIKDETGKILMLVSNTTLKNSICPDDNELRIEKGKRMYTSQNKSKFGNVPYEIHVMSYAEFGSRIKYSNKFIEDVNQIYCDEIHSLPEYLKISKSTGLTAAIKYLFDVYEDKQIFYFTATKDSLIEFKRKFLPELLDNVSIFDYLEHPKIKQYMALSEYKINHIEQIRPHLKARLRSFNYFGYKCLAFNRTIGGMKRIEQIATEEGFKPISLWSINNETEELKMTEEQLKIRSCLIHDGYLPEPYNFLIINSAMQEGWNLKDDKIKLAIMNTTNETEKTQALGRNRNDIDVLIYRIEDHEDEDSKVLLNEKWLNTSLTSEKKKELCNELVIVDSKGQLRKWPSVSKILEKEGYVIVNKTISINGKRTRVSTITK